MGIYEKLLTLQAKLKVPKGQYSDFGGYYYRSCEDITEAAKPLLVEVKAVLLLTDEIVVIGNRTYVKAVAKLIDTESDGVVEVDGYAREDESQKGKDVAQITGSCSSYARKYALNGLRWTTQRTRTHCHRCSNQQKSLLEVRSQLTTLSGSLRQSQRKKSLATRWGSCKRWQSKRALLLIASLQVTRLITCKTWIQNNGRRL